MWLLDEIDYRVQPPLIWHGEGGINAEPELGESNNIGYVQGFECLVVRNVEKDGLESSRAGHTISWRQLVQTCGEIFSVLRR